MTPTQREAIELAIADFEHIPAASGHVEFVERRIAALRAALAQPAPVQEPVAWASQTALDIAAEGGEGIIVGAEADCLIPLYTVPQPVPVQEPAAEILSDVIHRNAKKLVFTHHGLSLPVGTKLYTATQPAPVQEPEKLNPLTQLQVAYVMGLRDSNSALQAQQPRKAVKLSDSEIASDASRHWSEDGVDPIAFAHAIESAVWAKNGWAE